jgi:transposase
MFSLAFFLVTIYYTVTRIKGGVMAAIVYQTNKKTGVTYAYESMSYWDKDKKQSRAKRKCIGRFDPETKKIVPTHKKQQKLTGIKAKQGPVSITVPDRKFYGATYLFDRIGENTGIIDDLKACFSGNYRQILSIAYFLIMEDKNPLSRFPRWSTLHRHPYGDVITSQRSSELFASITEEAKQNFFRLQAKRRVEKEFLAYDTTSISSYSQCLKQVRYGKNKDHDPLPQINLALLFGQQSRLPFYYRKLPGNINDVKTLKKLLVDMNTLGYEKVKVVLDRGFFSAANINGLYKQHMKFLIGAKLSLKIVKEKLDSVRDEVRNWTNYSQEYHLYTYSVPVSWNYEQDRPYKGDTIKAKRRMYLHLYFSPERALEAETAFNKRMAQLQNELESGQRHPDHEKLYFKYFEVKTTPIRGIKVQANDKAMAEAKRNYGYFALLSNEIKDAVPALEIYRNKDVVEKAFCNLKDRMSMRRLAVSSEKSLDGKLFVQFIGLIFVSYITKKMQDNNLFSNHTLQEILDDLDIIECFEVPAQKLQVGEATKRQLGLYAKLGVDPPVSLQ